MASYCRESDACENNVVDVNPIHNRQGFRNYTQERHLALKLVYELEKRLDDMFETYDVLKDSFTKRFECYLDNINLHKKRLQENFPLVVVGETSSGKSSFLNLMLGAAVLPVDHQHSTAGIIKIKKGDLAFNVTGERSLKFRSVNDKNKDAEILRKQLEKTITSREGGADLTETTKYTEVTIFWPHDCPILQHDVTIVDTPGFGRTKYMDGMLMKYLPKAVAFLYIANAGNAGGIEPDKLRKVIDAQYEYCKKHGVEHIMDSRRALFFFNKWDQINSVSVANMFDLSFKGNGDNQEKIWKINLKILDTLWVDFHETQAMRFSVKKALKRKTCFGVDIDQVEKAQKKLTSVVGNSLQHGLDPSKRWLGLVSNHIIETFGLYISSEGMSYEAKLEMVNRFKLKRKETETLNEDKLKAMQNKFVEEVDKLMVSVSSYIQSEDFKSNMKSLAYGDSDISLYTGTKKEIEKKVSREVSERWSYLIRKHMKPEFKKFSEDVQTFLHGQAEILLKALDDLHAIFRSKHTHQFDATHLLANVTLLDAWISPVNLDFRINYAFDKIYENRIARFLQLYFKESSEKVNILLSATSDFVENVNVNELKTNIKIHVSHIETSIDKLCKKVVPNTIASLQVKCNDIENSTETRVQELNIKFKSFFEGCKILNET